MNLRVGLTPDRRGRQQNCSERGRDRSICNHCKEREGMETMKVREALSVGEEESARVSGLELQARPRPQRSASFFEGFALRGIRVDRIQPGSLTCTFKVPPRLTDKGGRLHAGAVASLVDEVGAAATLADGHHWKVSVDMSISYMSPAKLHDELEITSKVLGHKGGYSGTYILLKNKTTGEVIAEGRHSLFGNLRSKI